jgi:hypothetical protein
MFLSFPVLFYLVLRCVSDTDYFAEEAVIPPQSVGPARKLSTATNGPENGESEKADGIEIPEVVELEERVIE